MNRCERSTWLGFLLVLVLVFTPTSCTRLGEKGEKIGVLVVFHGGSDTHKPQYMWDATIEQFIYDPKHPVYRVIHSPGAWGRVSQVEVAAKYLRRNDFISPRIGGITPSRSVAEAQVADVQAELDKNKYGIDFEVDIVGYIWGDRPSYLPYPRWIYKAGFHRPEGKGSDVTYCGEDEPDGPWPDCDPNRFDVDGSVDRLLKKGVSRIFLVSAVVGGTRFYKPHYVYQVTKRRVDEWNKENGTSLSILWINDYSNLMERSYPTSPEGWTPSLGLQVEGFKDEQVLLKGSPNPVVEDPELAFLHVNGIEARMSDKVSDAKTGVILFGHAIKNNGEVYDPKIDDTITLCENIKSELLRRHPDMDPENILASWEGSAQLNPENGIVEVNRDTRGEDRGYSYLYQSDKQMPDHPWGYRNWDALEYLKNRGVKHIVIGHTHMLGDGAINLVEVPNEVAREIGWKTWAGPPDYTLYPGVGHPFADHWPIWVDTECDGEPCCFEMGGCADGRKYPPPRQAPLNQEMLELDPSLGYDVSEYGHLGYDPAKGPPNPNAPVQDQYSGTWTMWTPPNDNPGVGKLLAKHVLNAAVNPMVYITNATPLSGRSRNRGPRTGHLWGGTPPPGRGHPVPGTQERMRCDAR
jgi:hypothetical protein